MLVMTRGTLLSGLSTCVIGSRHTIALAAPGGRGPLLVTDG